MHDAIISIKPRHVENIISGAKTVELRTRNIGLPVGARLWVYTTLPVGKIEFSAEIEFIDMLSPKEIWDKHGQDICISKYEFDEYTKGRDLVSAIGMRDVRLLEIDLCLETMRGYEKNFQPPQFFSRLYPGRALYSALYA